MNTILEALLRIGVASGCPFPLSEIVFVTTEELPETKGLRLIPAFDDWNRRNLSVCVNGSEIHVHCDSHDGPTYKTLCEHVLKAIGDKPYELIADDDGNENEGDDGNITADVLLDDDEETD